MPIAINCFHYSLWYAMIEHEIKLNFNKMHLRNATIDDLQTLKYWDEQPHVIESDPNDEWDWENSLNNEYEWQELLIAEIGQKPVGFLQIINPANEESHYWGEISEGFRAIDIWIGEFENTGKGYGGDMMKMALDRCFRNREVNTVLIDLLSTNLRAIRFYERLGFRFIENRRFGQDDCKVYAITRSEWQSIQNIRIIESR